MKRKIIIIIFILNYFQHFNFSAQNHSIDSIKVILKTSKADTNKVNTLNELAQRFKYYNPDTSFIIANQALLLSQKLNYKKGEAWAEFHVATTYDFKRDHKNSLLHYNNALRHGEDLLSSKKQNDIDAANKLMIITLSKIAVVHFFLSDYPKAKEYYLSGLKLSEKTNDKPQAAITLIGIANVNYCQSDYPNALLFYFKGLKLYEEIGDKKAIGKTLVGVANVYKAESDFTKALEYSFKGLKIFEEEGEKQTIAGSLGNIANVYLKQTNYPRALEYYLKSLKIAEEVNDKQQIGRTLGNIAIVYHNQSNYDKAMEYYLKGLKISEEAGNTQQICLTLGNLGNLYTIIGKYKEAEAHLKKALSISIEIGADNNQILFREFLVQLYEKTNRPALALEHYKKCISLRDTIFSQENSKKLMRTEMDHEYEKKKAVADAEHKVQIENQKLIAAEKDKKQNVIIVSVIAGFILVFVFAVFVFRSLRITHKQKIIIEQKNAETEHQKKEIEDKQKAILDSIHYAKRIQQAQIPSEKMIDKYLTRLRK